MLSRRLVEEANNEKGELYRYSHLVLNLGPMELAQDPGWPRQPTDQGAVLVYYQPEVATQPPSCSVS